MLCKENGFSLIDFIDIDSSQINSIKYSSNKSCFYITDVPLHILRAEGTHFFGMKFLKGYTGLLNKLQSGVLLVCTCTFECR